MKWVRIEHDGQPVYGFLKGQNIHVVNGTPWGDNAETATILTYDSAKLLVPTVPSVFYCAGLNYAAHIIEMAKLRGVEPQLPKSANIGYRTNNSLVAHGEAIIKPKDAHEEFQYEGELVAIFGKRAKNVTKEEALDCVFGWTIGNDVSERIWQKQDSTMWRSKNCDTFKPMGPWIETDPDFNDMQTIISIDGNEVERFDTLNMIFDAATFISETSRYATIEPGDVMWLGTDGMPGNIKPGNRVSIEITGLGTLTNPVVAEE